MKISKIGWDIRHWKLGWFFYNDRQRNEWMNEWMNSTKKRIDLEYLAHRMNACNFGGNCCCCCCCCCCFCFRWSRCWSCCFYYSEVWNTLTPRNQKNWYGISPAAAAKKEQKWKKEIKIGLDGKHIKGMLAVCKVILQVNGSWRIGTCAVGTCMYDFWLRLRLQSIAANTNLMWMGYLIVAYQVIIELIISSCWIAFIIQK